MARQNFNVEFDFRKLLPKLLDRRTGRQIGLMLKTQTIEFLERGQSPVRGKRRLVAYKVPRRYPGKRKPPRPVNLFLRGDLYKSFGHKLIRGKKEIIFGVINPQGKVFIYAPVHNRDDTRRPDIPERRYVPSRRGDQFAVSITDRLKSIVGQRLFVIIRKSQRK